MIRVYLDTCCFNRPFDDQTQLRIRLESGAIIDILRHVARGRWTMIGSDAIDDEIAAIRDPVHRARTRRLASYASEHVPVDADLTRRGETLESMGFRSYDSMHIACAEAAGADALLTTDDALVRRARRLREVLGLHVANPLTWRNEG
jgi:predicted nucleic acid-binding protein